MEKKGDKMIYYDFGYFTIVFIRVIIMFDLRQIIVLTRGQRLSNLNCRSGKQ